MTYAGPFIKLTAIESRQLKVELISAQQFRSNGTSDLNFIFCFSRNYIVSWKINQRSIGFVLHSERIFLKLFFCKIRESEGELSTRKNVTLLPNSQLIPHLALVKCKPMLGKQNCYRGVVFDNGMLGLSCFCPTLLLRFTITFGNSCCT